MRRLDRSNRPPARLAPLALALLASAACREPHTAQTNLAGEIVDGGNWAGPIQAVPIHEKGRLTVTDKKIQPLKLLFNELTQTGSEILPYDVVGNVDRACATSHGCATVSDCAPMLTCDTDAGVCTGTKIACEDDADCARPIECIDERCVVPSCGGWEPPADAPTCLGAVACQDVAESHCLTLYWDADPATTAQTPVLSETGPDVPLQLLKALDPAGVGCASLPLNLDLPEDLLGPIPLLHLERFGLPAIARHTTLGTPTRRTCDVLGCSGDLPPEEPCGQNPDGTTKMCSNEGPINAAGLWIGARVVPTVPLQKEITCSLQSAAPSSQLCAQLLAEVDPAIHFSILPYCASVKFGIRVNSIPIQIGLIPAEGAPGGGAWTASLFPGAKDFHLADMFRVVPVVAGKPSFAFGALSDDADVTAYVDLVPVDAPNGFGCDIIQGGAQGTLNDLVRKQVRGAFAGIHRRIESTLHDFLMFEENLPPYCAMSGCDEDPDTEAPLCCGEDDRLERWAAAAMTYHKWQWFAAPFVGIEQPYGEGWLPITGVSTETGSEPQCDDTPTNAGLHAECDGISTILHFDFDPDQDGDGLLTYMDPAPTCASQFNLDSDDDDVIDACDECPDDPWSSSDELGQGGDGDGVCGNLDNCPGVYNPKQENCNVDWELVHTPLDVRGDACDPVPCPRILPVYASESSELMQCQVLTGLEVQPLAPRPIPGGGTDIPADWPVAGVKTSAWFCMDDPAHGVECTSDAAVTEDWLFTSTCADQYPGTAVCAWGPGKPLPSPETVEDWFHRIDLEESDSHVVELDYVDLGAGAPVPLTWNWREDLERWLDTGIIDPSMVTDIPVLGESAITGRLWLHSVSKMGSPSNPVPSLHGKWLSNSFLDVTTARCKPNPWFQTPIFSPCLIDPASCIEIPWRPDIYVNPWDLVARWDAASPLEASVLVPAGRGVGAMLGSGLAELVDDRVGAGARSRIAQGGLRWLASAEASLAIGSDPAAASVVALDGEGRLAGLLYSQGAELLSEADLGQALPRAEPAPLRSGFAAVYVRSRGQVLAVGPSAVKGFGAEVWSMDVSTGAWTPVAQVTDSAGEVVVATYSHTTRTLAWLERDGDLLALRTLHGTAAATAWTGKTAYDHHGLAADIDGRVVLSASHVGGGYVVAQLGACADPPQPDKGAVNPPQPDKAGSADPPDPDKGLLVTGLTEGSASLPFAPLTDALGMTLLEVDPKEGTGRALRATLTPACGTLDLAGK